MGEIAAVSLPNGAIAQLDVAAFWAKVDTSGECWPWLGAHGSEGYGVLHLQRRPLLAHRVADELTNGPIPKGIFICHHCDNRICCRPSHLFRGTPRQNVTDMLLKGRHSHGDNHYSRREPHRLACGERNGMNTKPERRPCGERHGNSKLTAAQVAEIRVLAQSGRFSQYLLAEMYGVSQAAIWYVIHHRTWRSVALTRSAVADALVDDIATFETIRAAAGGAELSPPDRG